MISSLSFGSFSHAGYATDVTFQQSYRRCGSIQEGNVYFSGKHKLYGYKVEMSIIPVGLAISRTTHYPGSVSNWKVFK